MRLEEPESVALNSKGRERDLCAYSKDEPEGRDDAYRTRRSCSVGSILARALTSLCHIGHHKSPSGFVRTDDDGEINSDNDPVHGSEKGDAS